jgi:hypothetical protein
MAAQKEDRVARIVELYDKGNGDSVSDIAQAMNMTAASVTYHLKAQGVFVARGGHSTVSQASVRVETADANSDEVLGIGVDDAPLAQVDVQALLNHPDLAKVIDAMVNQRLAALAPQTARSGEERAFDAFLAKFDHMLEVQAEQRPGYIKPLSADEIDARRQGREDMFTLLREYKAANVWPEYLLSDEANPYYGPSPNGDILYEAGQKIASRRPPGEGWVALNEPAMKIYEAYRRWVGDVIPIDDLIAQAAAIARGDSSVATAEMPAQARIEDPDVRLISSDKVEVGPKRVMGTLAPELRGKTMPRQPGVAPEPAGPVFVSDA